MRALRIRVFCLVDCCSQMGFACDDGAFFSAAMHFPFPWVSMLKKIYVIEVRISVEFQESFVVQELPKKVERSNHEVDQASSSRVRSADRSFSPSGRDFWCVLLELAWVLRSAPEPISCKLSDTLSPSLFVCLFRDRLLYTF